MGTLAKIFCIGFEAFYILGVLLYAIGPHRKRFKPRLENQNLTKARDKQ
jgi:hypothetical protein